MADSRSITRIILPLKRGTLQKQRRATPEKSTEAKPPFRGQRPPQCLPAASSFQPRLYHVERDQPSTFPRAFRRASRHDSVTTAPSFRTQPRFFTAFRCCHENSLNFLDASAAEGRRLITAPLCAARMFVFKPGQLTSSLEARDLLRSQFARRLLAAARF